MLTAAPTGTVGMIHGASTGIEPIFAPMYDRRYREGNTWKSQMVLDPLFKKDLESGGNGRHIVGSYDITPEQHMAVQACIQKYVDNAISKTINLPEDADHEVVSKMALKYAPYLKGITVYRAGSKGMEPLKALPLTDENIAKAKELVASEQAESEMIVEACRIGGECGA